MASALILTLAAIAAAALGSVAIFNRLIALGRRCDQAGADIDVQLKQRFDLIPNLVEIVKGYAGHERSTLEAVMKARGAVAQATTPQSQGAAQGMLGLALGRLLAVAEAYPDLKASSNFSALQDELADIENKIAAARRFLNSAVAEYNTTLEQFPANAVGGLFGFASRDPHAVTRDERPRLDTAPLVKF